MAAKYNFKGGRTAAVPMRFTPEEKAALQAAAASAGMSMSDFVLMLLQRYQDKQSKG